MRSIVGLSIALTACGGAAPGSPSTQATTTAAESTPTSEWTTRAQEALARGDLDRAIFAAENALQLNRADESALEIAAVIGLARRTPDEVRSLLREMHAPKFVKLRARAAWIKRDFEALRDELANLPESEDDTWSREMRRVASAMGAGAAYETTARDFAIRYVTRDTPNYAGPPVVGVEIDGALHPAVIATSVNACIVDQSLRRESGKLDALTFDSGDAEATVQNVPFVSADVSQIATPMGPARMVLGLDFLLAMRATLDGPQGSLVLGSTCEAVGCDAGATQQLPLLTMNGTMPLVEARAENAEGFFLLDTAQSFPVAVLESVAVAIGRNARDLVRDGAPVAFPLETFTLGQTALEGVPAFAAGVPETLSTQARVPVLGVMGAPLLRPFVVRFDEEVRALTIAVR